VLCKLTHYAEKLHTAAALKFSTPEKHRKSAVSKLLSGQSSRIFGEGIANYPLLVGPQDNAPEYGFLDFVFSKPFLGTCEWAFCHYFPTVDILDFEDEQAC